MIYCLLRESKSYRRLVVSLVCLFFVLTDSVFSAAETVYELPDYKVTARHFDQPILDVPADVVLVSRMQIDQSLAASVPELLANEANLFFTHIGGQTNLAMRGFGEGSGLRSLVLVDGQPLNPVDMSRVNWEQIPINSIESVEVLRGGHNVLYGDKALAGVIKIKTRREASKYFNLEQRIRSYGDRSTSVDGGTYNNRWRLRSGASYQKKDGFRQNSKSNMRHAYMNIGYNFPSKTDFDLHLSLGKNENQYPGALDYFTYKADPYASSNLGDEYNQVKFASLSAILKGAKTWGDWQIITGLDSNDTDWSLGAGKYGINEQSGMSLRPYMRYNRGLNSLSLGLDLLYDKLDFTEFSDAAHKLMLGDAELSESRISPYFLFDHRLNSELTLTAGMRHDWTRYQANYDRFRVVGAVNRPGVQSSAMSILADTGSFDEVVYEDGSSYTASLNYRLNRKWSLWAAVAKVYRYPVFDERASYQGYTLAENLSTNLEAEQGDNFEFGCKYIGTHYSFYLTGFILHMDNEIMYAPNITGSSGGAGLNINLGEVERCGADLSIAYHQEKWGFSSRSAFISTHMRAGENQGSAVPLVPNWRTVSQFWLKPIEWMKICLIHRFISDCYQGGDFTNSARNIDNYHLLEINSEWKFSPNVCLFFGLKNALDKHYPESVYNGAYYPGQTRTGFAGMKVSF